MRTGRRSDGDLEPIELIDIDENTFGFPSIGDSPQPADAEPNPTNRRWIAAAALGGTVALFAAGVALSRPSATAKPLATIQPASSAASNDVVAATDPSVAAPAVADPAATDPATTDPPATDRVVSEAMFAPEAAIAALVPVIPDGYDVERVSYHEGNDVPPPENPLPDQVWAAGATPAEGPWLIASTEIASTEITTAVAGTGTSAKPTPAAMGDHRLRLANGAPAVALGAGAGITTLAGPGVSVRLRSSVLTDAQLIDIAGNAPATDGTLRSTDGSVVMHRVGSITTNPPVLVDIGLRSFDGTKSMTIAVSPSRTVEAGDLFLLSDRITVDSQFGLAGHLPDDVGGLTLVMQPSSAAASVSIHGDEAAETLAHIVNSMHPASVAEWVELQRRATASHAATQAPVENHQGLAGGQFSDGRQWLLQLTLAGDGSFGRADARIEPDGWTTALDPAGPSLTTAATFGATYVIAAAPANTSSLGSALVLSYDDGTTLTQPLVGFNGSTPNWVGAGIADTSDFRAWTASIVAADGTLLATRRSDGT